MGSEADIVRSIMKKLCSIDGVFCFRTHGSSFQMKGTPDIIGCAKGNFFAIEVKKDKTKSLSVAQKYVLNLLETAGGKTFSVYGFNLHEVILWIKSL